MSYKVIKQISDKVNGRIGHLNETSRNLGTAEQHKALQATIKYTLNELEPIRDFITPLLSAELEQKSKWKLVNEAEIHVGKKYYCLGTYGVMSRPTCFAAHKTIAGIWMTEVSFETAHIIMVADVIPEKPENKLG